MLGSLSFYGQADKHGYVDGTPMANILYSKGKFTASNMLRGTPYSHYVSKNDQDNGEGLEHTVTDVLVKDRALTDNLSLRYAFNKSDRIDVYGSVNLLKENYAANSITGTDNLLLGNKLKSHSYSAGIQMRKGFGKMKVMYCWYQNTVRTRIIRTRTILITMKRTRQSNVQIRTTLTFALACTGVLRKTWP